MWDRVIEAAPIEVRETPNAIVGAVVGSAYLFAGVVAFAIAAGSGMAVSPGHHAAGLGGVHCAMYVVVGIGLLVAVLGGRSRLVNTVVGAAYLIAGLALIGSEGGPQLLALHEPDNLLHLVSAAVLLGFGRTQE